MFNMYIYIYICTWNPNDLYFCWFTPPLYGKRKTLKVRVIGVPGTFVGTPQCLLVSTPSSIYLP